MRRRLRSVPLFVVAALLAACAAREPARPPGSGAREPAPAPPAATAPSESLLSGRGYSLMNPKLALPALPDWAVPLDTPDPRYAEYFAELNRRIESKWSYPTEASRNRQSGQGEIRFVLRKSGTLETVEVVRSSGVKIRDSYIANAIRLASPFPPIPASVGKDVLPISVNFTYTLL